MQSVSRNKKYSQTNLNIQIVHEYLWTLIAFWNPRPFPLPPPPKKKDNIKYKILTLNQFSLLPNYFEKKLYNILTKNSLYITLWVFGYELYSLSLPARFSCTRCAACIVQCVQCLWYKVCRVYCTWYAVCIVQDVQCVLYKVGNVYCTLSRLARYRVNKGNIHIKSDIT